MDNEVPNRIAIIDIGSNSVRLVVYGGARRAPSILFNEKVSAGLGRLDVGRCLKPEARAAALRALKRFAVLVDDMEVTDRIAVATAAVRDAADGPQFLEEMCATGLPVRLIDGQREAELAGLGVLSAIPDADGLVGDLGGGSLELVRVSGGQVGDRLSLPLGVLRLAGRREAGGGTSRRAMLDHVSGLLKRSGWTPFARSMPFYMVGGSWRAVARVHMATTDYPVQVLHEYCIDPREVWPLLHGIQNAERKSLKGIPGMPGSRLAVLEDATRLLGALAELLHPSALVTSASGVREGLLYDRLTAQERAEDPLLVAARLAAGRAERFNDHGDLLDRWIAPLFLGESAEDRRLRQTACLLSDMAWAATPDFRAERGVDIALHEPWTAIDVRGRVVMAHALATSFGGDALVPAIPKIGMLVNADAMQRACAWGLAMRLGQRLSGGVAPPLRRSQVAIVDGSLVLTLEAGARHLYGEAVEKRHHQLASFMGLIPVVQG